VAVNGFVGGHRRLLATWSSISIALSAGRRRTKASTFCFIFHIPNRYGELGRLQSRAGLMLGRLARPSLVSPSALFFSYFFPFFFSVFCFEFQMRIAFILAGFELKSNKFYEI
jgi:hypothetical protein